MKIVKAGILTAGLIGLLCSVGCNSHKTSEGTIADKSDIFVDTDGTTGTITLEVRDTELAVGETTHFGVSVKRSDGTGVEGMRVTCDSELGLAILEPTTGSELTDSWGGVSGVIGCAAPGSLQLGCRLPVGVNKRQLQSIHCTGETPAGFTGWPNAAGGGLGGGVVDPTSSTDDVRVNLVGFIDSQSDLTSTTLDYAIDTVEDQCGTSAPYTDEPWFNTFVQFTVVNGTDSLMRLSSYKFEVNNYTSDWLAFSVNYDLPPNSTDGVVLVAGFAEAIGGYKRFYGSTDLITITGFENITFTIGGENVTSGESIEFGVTTGAYVGNVDRCPE